MLLIDLIKTNNWFNVSNTLLSLFPSENKNCKGYEKIFRSLLLLEVKHSNMLLVIENIEEDSLEDNFSDVYGLLYDPVEQMQIKYSIELTPWCEWLGITISEDTLRQFSELEIISHCLYEMTFFGFSERKIQTFQKKLDEQSQKINNMSPEEIKKNQISSEKFLAKLRKGS